MDSSPIPLPSASVPPRRSSLPLVAAVVPVGVGVAMWLTTGAVQALWFAAVGPLMIGASLLDTVRIRRRERRADDARLRRAWSEAESELRRRHDEERRREERRHPDTAACVRERPLRDARPPGPETALVVGRGHRASAVRCVGGDDDTGREFRRRCTVLDDAPVVVPLGAGLCLRGPGPLVEATARALVLQLCLRHAPAALAVTIAEESVGGLAALPHARYSRRAAFRLAVATPEGRAPDATAVVWVGPPDAEVPEGVTTVIDIAQPDVATLRTPEGVTTLAVECLSVAQAAGVAELCGGLVDDETPATEPLSLQSVTQPSAGSGLPVALGRAAQDEPMTVDIVDDGPHAIVTGMTGTGKSELLVTWVAAVCASQGPERVTFLLADFKGGTAFDRLRDLPHVVGVLTDLDETEAGRGVASLTAEMRRRESLLAAAGARDISEIDLARLVIVVDEFAALLHEHAELAAVFTDVAARGRALGMHLILGTQRAAGVIRDALATNCPLRISLRVAEAADSRAVVGTAGAAELPGGVDGRGRALVRRPQDEGPRPVRIALTDDAFLERIVARGTSAPTVAPPWYPALPTRLPLTALTAERDALRGSMPGPLLVLGRADDPAAQAQPPVTLRPGLERGLVVLGAAGMGRTTVLRGIAAQDPTSAWFPTDLEAAVDQVAAWEQGEAAIPGTVLVDDIDRLQADLPLEYGQDFALRWERLVRSAATVTWVLTATRATGPLARVLDALPRRALLRMPSRVEHLAAGGEIADFRRDRPPGRALLDDREMQFAWVDEEGEPRSSTVVAGGAESGWVPATASTALVTPGARGVAAALAAAHPEWEVALLGAEVGRTARPCVVVGDAETWQRHWTDWQRARSEGEVLIRAERPAELRQLVGVRTLPPYARQDAGRAWSVVGDRAPRRVVLPALAPR